MSWSFLKVGVVIARCIVVITDTGSVFEEDVNILG
jgi:hypothetical protein